MVEKLMRSAPFGDALRGEAGLIGLQGEAGVYFASAFSSSAMNCSYSAFVLTFTKPRIR